MIKEYINTLVDENNKSLEKLEQEMKELIEDLESNQKWLEKLQREKNLDTNIFSPRSMDVDIREKIEKAQAAVEKVNHSIDHIRILIEEHVKKKLEYEKLLTEADESPFLDLLSDLYKRTEICLATINSDQNKCRNELKNIKHIIKDYAVKIENNKKMN